MLKNGCSYPLWQEMLTTIPPEGLSVASIERSVKATYAHVSSIVKELTALGLINKEKDDTNMREMRVTLTKSGQSVKANIIEVMKLVKTKRGIEVKMSPTEVKKMEEDEETKEDPAEEFDADGYDEDLDDEHAKEEEVEEED